MNWSHGTNNFVPTGQKQEKNKKIRKKIVPKMACSTDRHTDTWKGYLRLVNGSSITSLSIKRSTNITASLICQ